MSQQSIALPSALDLDNIQGDILSGLPKKTETFLFFQITNVGSFRNQLFKYAPRIKTVAQVLKDRKDIEDHKKKGDKTLMPMVGVNIAFSHKGLVKMGIDDSVLTGDANFLGGQKADAHSLGDKGTGIGPNFVPDWKPAFLQEIHGVILVSGESHKSVNKAIQEAKQAFGVLTSKASIKEVISTSGDVRPDKEAGHEHFGFLDGISNPSVIGFDKNPNPGPKPIPAGVMVMGHEGDTVSNRSWAVDGSFLVFRYLSQTVLEFDNFLRDHPVLMPGLTPAEGSELLGARLVGRWKSGAPVDLSPFEDDPTLGVDPQKNNNFHFSAETNFQKICPFAAHVRKTNPRADLEGLTPPISIQNQSIMRRGIPFGPEVTGAERQAGKTANDRGLLFVCYQTSITNGFAFMQKNWANNPNFPFGEKTPEVPGLDPIIGQGDRKLSGTDPNNPATELSVPEFVLPRGGEYFFSPSLKALKETLGTGISIL